MPRLRVLAHQMLCPQGGEFEVRPFTRLCDALIEHGIKLEHACGKAGVCATCHVIVRAGMESLEAPLESEEDALDRVWGLTRQSRLACRVMVGNDDLLVEIPRYSVNLAREDGNR